MDTNNVDAAVLAGASMGAHTIVRFALAHPERVRALVLITPAFAPGGITPKSLERWDRLSDGLRDGGVDGFLEAYGDPPVPEKFRDTVRTVVRQRLSAHRHPEAVADALRYAPRSEPFTDWSELARIQVPTVVVASRDEVDPEHPFDIGRRYAEEIPGAQLVTEEPGQSPLAWQGSRLSKVIAEVAAQ
jgi:pimeloyl-ACP methyl ester carboxylesterase